MFYFEGPGSPLDMKLVCGSVYIFLLKNCVVVVHRANKRLLPYSRGSTVLKKCGSALFSIWLSYTYAPDL